MDMSVEGSCVHCHHDQIVVRAFAIHGYKVDLAYTDLTRDVHTSTGLTYIMP